MPHYYFDLVDGERVYDKYGIKLPDLVAARAYAQKLADEFRKNPAGVDLVKIVVKDNKFQPVLSVPLKPER